MFSQRERSRSPLAEFSHDESVGDEVELAKLKGQESPMDEGVAKKPTEGAATITASRVIYIRINVASEHLVED